MTGTDITLDETMEWVSLCKIRVMLIHLWSRGPLPDYRARFRIERSGFELWLGTLRYALGRNT